MTIEDVIKHCDEVAAGETEQGKCPECAADHKQLAEWLRELVALRAQQTPLDRSRWEGCSHCDDKCCCTCRYSITLEKNFPCRECDMGSKYDPQNYCSNCGRPLTEEAWAELERRIGGNDGTTDN